MDRSVRASSAQSCHGKHFSTKTTDSGLQGLSVAIKLYKNTVGIKGFGQYQGDKELGEGACKCNLIENVQVNIPHTNIKHLQY